MSTAQTTAGQEGQGRRFVLRLPAETGYLAVVRELVASAAREHQFPATEVAKAVMAVDEACVNVVEHAYPGARSDPPQLEVEVDVDPERLEVVIADRAAHAFSPLDHPLLDLEDYWQAGTAAGGLGILIMRRFMDHVSHSYRPGRGNELHLVKYASPRSAASV